MHIIIYKSNEISSFIAIGINPRKMDKITNKRRLNLEGVFVSGL